MLSSPPYLGALGPQELEGDSMQPTLVPRSTFLSLILALVPMTCPAWDTLCPTPIPIKNTCQAGRCSQTVYTTGCSISQNEVHECADFDRTVPCCGGGIPTLTSYPCGIQSTSLPMLDLLAREFGGTRVFVLTCSRGYLRLGRAWRMAQ